MTTPTPNGCIEPTADAILLVSSEDGCELYAEIDHSGPHPTVELHATTPWDTHIQLNGLTFEQVGQIATRLTQLTG